MTLSVSSMIMPHNKTVFELRVQMLGLSDIDQLTMNITTVITTSNEADSFSYFERIFYLRIYVIK